MLFNKQWVFWGIVLGVCSLTTTQAENKVHNFDGIKFVKIEAGCFDMGGDASFKETRRAELPLHPVCIAQGFYLGQTEVTQAQWNKLMGNNPSKFTVNSHPVEQVTWEDAQAFVQRLNAQVGKSVYRLPTEAEWEYAARAGSEAAYAFGDNPKNLAKYAWYGNEGYGGRTSPVGLKEPNAWGLYDMHGNVWEWVQDWFGDTYYASSPKHDPKGPESGKFRVYRGGSWISNAMLLRVATRFSGMPNSRSRDIGFRLLRELD